MKHRHKNKTFLILQYSTFKSTAAGIQGLAWSEQARRVTAWRRVRRWEMVEPKDRQQQMEGKLQFHSCLMWIECMFGFLKIHT